MQPRSAILKLLREGKHLAAELPHSAAGYRTFIGVYPLDLSSERSRAFLKSIGIDVFPNHGHAYHSRRFTIHRSLIDASAEEPDLLSKVSLVAFSESELVDQLDQLGASLEALDLPDRCEYPI